MKAVAFSAFDHSPELIDIDAPTAAEGEVRVRIEAASVNGFDLAVANGYLNGMMEHRFPVVLGKDFAGTVDQVGPGVDGYEIGDRVFGVVTKDFLGDGSFAEFVTVPVTIGVAKLPDTVTFIEAAGLGLAGTAAADSFDAAQVTTGTTVLIAGATGGVGTQALQLALRAGADVIVTAHSTEELEAVKALGATQIVDYTGDVAAQVRALRADGVDVVLHFAGDPAALASATKKGGRFVSTLAQSAEQLGGAEDVEFISIYATPTTPTLDRLAKNQAEGHTAVSIQRAYPLAEAPAAFADFAGGTLGKLIITI
ncbi:NADP-dependent oxidoreductase [Subtercola endophyticus]|uniref:NADP-dependent oxidoreductase n=1 Tax=Subtercola endophyticus TaxID=2895559 RepID=UPI001E294C75|nr:NADP-dependent oxidoreductase [Subtercola endophyticus]UFS58091.1 NADP-dependent oxidoreductase [Subtercola endophyticus]